MANANELKKLNKPDLAIKAVEAGFEVEGTETKDELIDMILSVEGGDTKAADTKAAEQTKRFKLTINEQEGIDGEDDVLLSINGKAWRIKRGIEVVVPHEVIHVLDNSVKTLFERDEEGKTVERNVKRFSYSYRPA